jgi:hypothetical protein
LPLAAPRPEAAAAAMGATAIVAAVAIAANTGAKYVSVIRVSLARWPLTVAAAVKAAATAE